jgi:archaellum component FlaC
MIKMINVNWSRYLILALLLSVSIFVYVLPAHAVPLTLDLAPSDVAVGDIVSATGSGATTNGEVRLYIGSLVLTSTTADSVGNFSARFIVPPVPQGNHTIIELDVESGFNSIAHLTVEPRILVTPTITSFNDQISIRGEGFAAYENITLWLEEVEVTPTSTPTTDFLGTFETGFKMVSTPNGTYTLSARDRDGNAAKTLMTVSPKILVQPTSGPASTFTWVYGYGFSAFTEFVLNFGPFDVTAYGHALTSSQGSFITAFLVPDVSEGTYSISASDNMGNVAASTFAVPSPRIMLTPSTIFESSLITVEGIGFQPTAPIALYFEDTATAIVYDLMESGAAILPETSGTFHYTFVSPITRAGVYEVTAYNVRGPQPSDLNKVASVTLTIMNRASIDAEITTGTLYFRNETAEFYLKTALNGELVDVHLDKALVYFANGDSEQDLTSNVTEISTGLYRMQYEIPEDAPFGTYTLLAGISLHSSLLEAFGTATASFVISPFFTTQTAQLIDLQNNIATVITTDLGTLKANLSAVNARLGSIEGNIATIQSDIGTLQTNVDVINAKIVDIEGNMTTVQSDLGTLKTSVSSINATLVAIDGNTATIDSTLGTIRTSADAIHAKVTSIEDDVATVSSDIGTVKVKISEFGNQTVNAAMLAVSAAAIAALAASVSALILYKRKSPEPAAETSEPPPPPPDTPLNQSAQDQIPSEEQKQEQAQNQTGMPKEEETTETTPQETAPATEQPPQTQPPPDSPTPQEPPPPALPEPQTQPQLIVLQPEEPASQ